MEGGREGGRERERERKREKEIDLKPKLDIINPLKDPPQQ